MERQKQNYRIGFPIASIYSAKLRPNRLGPNIQNQQKIKGPIQQHCIPSGRGRLRPPGPPGQGARRPLDPPTRWPGSETPVLSVCSGSDSRHSTDIFWTPSIIIMTTIQISVIYIVIVFMQSFKSRNKKQVFFSDMY